MFHNIYLLSFEYKCFISRFWFVCEWMCEHECVAYIKIYVKHTINVFMFWIVCVYQQFAALYVSIF